jgi:hypothetical protein
MTNLSPPNLSPADRFENVAKLSRTISADKILTRADQALPGIAERSAKEIVDVEDRSLRVENTDEGVLVESEYPLGQVRFAHPREARAATQHDEGGRYDNERRESGQDRHRRPQIE